MKDAIITKVALSASDLYTETLNTMQQTEVSGNLPKEWIPIVAGKQALMHAYSEYHQALVCRASAKYGQEIARLQVSEKAYFKKGCGDFGGRYCQCTQPCSLLTH